MITLEEFEQLEEFDIVYFNFRTGFITHKFPLTVRIETELHVFNHMYRIDMDSILIKSKVLCKECLVMLTCNRSSNILDCYREKYI